MPEETGLQNIELVEGSAYPTTKKPELVITSGEEMAYLMSQAQDEEDRWVNRQL